MKAGIIIQARCGSSRLPDKMILPFYKDDSILSVLLKRIKKELPAIPVVVATTIHPRDNAIENICLKNNTFCFKGDENNVLKRFIDAAKHYNFARIIRVCADNPFLYLESLKELTDNISHSTYDYVCYSTSNATPTIKTHYGFWGEAVTLEALEKVAAQTQDQLYIEHVTNYIYAHPEKFNLKLIPVSQEIEKRKLRLTVDTEEDFCLQKEIFSELINTGLSINPSNIISIIDAHPEYYNIMDEQIKKNSK